MGPVGPRTHGFLENRAGPMDLWFWSAEGRPRPMVLGRGFGGPMVLGRAAGPPSVYK